MITHPTLEAARTYAQAKGVSSVTSRIIEIEHETDGRCYIVCYTNLDGLRSVLEHAPAGKRMPEIKRLITEHDIRSDEEIAALTDRILTDDVHCERCGVHVDGHTAYRQQERYKEHRVWAWYCEPCRRALATIGDGECTALQERSQETEPNEPCTKSD